MYPPHRAYRVVGHTQGECLRRTGTVDPQGASGLQGCRSLARRAWAMPRWLLKACKPPGPLVLPKLPSLFHEGSMCTAGLSQASSCRWDLGVPIPFVLCLPLSNRDGDMSANVRLQELSVLQTWAFTHQINADPQPC